MSGIFCNPLFLSLGTRTIILPLRLIVTSCTLNSAVYPASHSLPIETSEIFARLDMMCPPHDSSFKAGKYIRHGLLDCMVWPFWNPTIMGGLNFVDR